MLSLPYHVHFQTMTSQSPPFGCVDVRFLQGRRPDHTRAWNFINHFRQADCGLELPDTALNGTLLTRVAHSPPLEYHNKFFSCSFGF